MSKLSRSDKLTILIFGGAILAVICTTVGILAYQIVSGSRPLRRPLPVVPTAKPEAEIIEIVTSTAYNSGDTCAVVEGQIKNVSDRPLALVKIVITYSDINHKFLSSDWGYPAYRILSPGDVSPFKKTSCFPSAPDFEYFSLGFQIDNP